MDGLRKSFTKMFSSGLEKIVLDLLDDSKNNFIDEEACERFAVMLEGRSSKYTKQEALHCLLKNARKAVTWSAMLKALMIIHKLTHMEGDLLAEFLVSNKLDNIANFKIQSQPLKQYVHSAMVPHYYKYLQKLSYNYKDLSICFFQDDNFSNRLKENDLSLLHFICKVQNILGYLSDMLPFLEVSITQFGKTDLVRQISYFCLTDCYHYYTYIGQALEFIIKEIFSLRKSDALFLYEIYCDHIRMTNKLKSLFQLKNYLKEFFLKIPDFYRIDLELNKQVEFYINDLKNGKTVPENNNSATESPSNDTPVNPFTSPAKNPSPNPKSSDKKSSAKKPKFTQNLEIEVQEDQDQEQLENVDKLAPPSLQELSKVLGQITTPNFKSVQKKELFKAPMVNRKLSALSSPKLLVTNPNGEIQQGQNAIDLSSKSGPIKHSDFNPFMSNRINPAKITVAADRSVQSERDKKVSSLEKIVEYGAVETISPIISANVSMSDSYIVGRKGSDA